MTIGYLKISLDDEDIREWTDSPPTSNNSRDPRLEQGRKKEWESKRIECQTSPHKDQNYESFNNRIVKYSRL